MVTDFDRPRYKLTGYAEPQGCLMMGPDRPGIGFGCAAGREGHASDPHWLGRTLGRRCGH